MAMQTYPFADMTGALTLVDQVSVLNPDTPIDARNIRVEVGGGFANRGGSDFLASFQPTADVTSLAFSSSGATDHILAAEGNMMRALRVDSGDSVLTQATSLAAPFSFARYGAPGTERDYFAQGRDIGYWNGTVFALNPVGLPKPRVLCVTPWDNRLLAIGYNGATDGPAGAASSPSHLYYSLEGDPNSWDPLRRELFYPGDGEQLVAGVTWRDRVFIFKQSKFWVIFGTTDTGGGVPELEFHAIDARLGVEGPLAVCAGRDAVYFVNRSGVYSTDGNEPQLLSIGLDPFFRGDAPIYFTGKVADPSEMHTATIEWADELVHVGFTAMDGTRMSLCYDPRTGWWGYDTLPLGPMCRAIRASDEVLAFAPPAGRVRYHDRHLVQDVGSPLRGGWRSGWHDFGAPDVKHIRMSRIVGEGVVQVWYGVDHRGQYIGGTARMNQDVDYWRGGDHSEDLWEGGRNTLDRWQVRPNYQEDWIRKIPVRGRLFSWAFKATAPFSVQRVEHYVGARPRRPAVDLTSNV